MLAGRRSPAKLPEGTWAAFHELADVAEAAILAGERPPTPDMVTWLPCNGNQAAGYLANVAMDQRASYCWILSRGIAPLR